MIPLAEGKVELHCGDCLEVMPSLPANSIDACVTDPPYGLRFMGKRWDTGETAFSVDFWAEVLRVLKPGGHVAAFGAPRGYHRMACAIEDAGFEIRDSLMWVYGTGFPKSQNVAKFIDKELGVDGALGGPRSAAHAAMLEKGVARRGDKHEGWNRPWMDDPEAVAAAQSTYLPGSPLAQEFDGFGTALKPAFEPIVLARKPLSESTVAANVLRWRTGALNIDACRVGAEGGGTNCNNRDENGKCLGHKNAGRSTSGETFHGPESDGAQGRWPANVVHDGSDEVVGAFPDSRGKQGRSTDSRRSQANVYGAPSDNGKSYEPRNDSGSAARFFYSAKASRLDRAGSKHPTVKPVTLKQWLARLITPPGGTVLDPFAGSGTTGAACALEGFRAVLIENESEYQADIRQRFSPSIQAEQAPVTLPLSAS